MAHFGGMWRSAFAGIDVADHPNVKRWYDQVASCPEVKVALSKIKALVPSTT
jgi:GST-like protein